MLHIVLALAAAMLFAFATPAAKAMLAAVPAFQLAGLLYLGAAIGALPLLLFGERTASPSKKPDSATIRRLAIALACGGVMAPVCLLLGLKLASASSVSMWLTLEAVFTSLLAFLMFKEHLGKLGWIALLISTMASALLCVGEGGSGIQAGLVVALACLFWAVDNNCVAVIDGISPAKITFLKGIVAGSINMLLGTIFQPAALTSTVVLQALVVGSLSYGLSITLYIMSAQGMGAARSQMIFATTPFWGVAFSGIFLHETLSALQLLAGLMMGGAIFALVSDSHAHDHEHEQMSHIHMHGHDDGHHNHTHEGEPPSLVHSHWHEHEPMRHSHPHWPDLHHRHHH